MPRRAKAGAEKVKGGEIQCPPRFRGFAPVMLPKAAGASPAGKNVRIEERGHVSKDGPYALLPGHDMRPDFIRGPAQVDVGGGLPKREHLRGWTLR